MGFRDGLPFVVAAVISVAGIGYGVSEHSRARELSNRQQAMSGAIGQLERQVQDLSDKMKQPPPVEEQPPAAPARPRRVPAARPTRVKRPAPVSRPVEDPRWKLVENRLATNEQQIASAKQDVEKTREDLERQVSLTKEELGGSIAKTHDEVVLLQKRGERDYIEFTLTKSKDFRKTGPVSLSLRKADTKHKRYNLQLVIDDAKLDKKNVNLYEPVYLSVNDRPQPVELVVNQITKDEVRGYVSQPKYKKSELVTDAAVRTKLPAPESPR